MAMFNRDVTRIRSVAPVVAKGSSGGLDVDRKAFGEVQKADPHDHEVQKILAKAAKETIPTITKDNEDKNEFVLPDHKENDQRDGKDDKNNEDYNDKEHKDGVSEDANGRKEKTPVKKGRTKAPAVQAKDETVPQEQIGNHGLDGLTGSPQAY